MSRLAPMSTNMTRCSRSLSRLLPGLALVAGLARGQWVTTATDTVTHNYVRKWLSMQAIACDSSDAAHVRRMIPVPSQPVRSAASEYVKLGAVGHVLDTSALPVAEGAVE